MKRVSSRRRYLPAGATILFVSALSATGSGLHAQQSLSEGLSEGSSEGVFVEEVVVTAQRRAQSLQEVPIAVSAFDAAALERLQIEQFTDLQFSTPNVTYSKANFTGNNFQIRGIGNALVAASSDSGVGIHVNDLPLNAPRLFELPYFDIERIEILRGPQGTLFGRNATGGVVNMITNKPGDAFEASTEVELGDYSSTRAEGMVNIPLTDDLFARFAGIVTKRDGYTENLFTGNDVDDRDSYAVRAALRWLPTDATTVDFMASWFDEDSSRTRSQKQMCNNDPTAVLGCLPDRLEFELPNSAATIAGGLSSDLILGPVALAPFGLDLYANSPNPADFRQVHMDFDPIYKSDELFLDFQLEHRFERHTLNLLAGYQDTSVFSEADYNNAVGQPYPALSDPVWAATMQAAFPIVYNTYFSQGTVPISEITDSSVGVIGGEIRRFSNLVDAYDRSSGESDQVMFELRLSSDYDGAWNYLVGANWFDYENWTDYYVVSNGLDYFSLLGSGVDGIAVPTPFFHSDTDFYGLTSSAAFGELYFAPAETVKITMGLRFTRDEKEIRDRAPLFAGQPTPIGSDSVVLPPYREDTVEFTETTGRLVVDWTPEIGFTESTLVYGSYSRGYKGGGFNPPFDPAVFPNTSPNFEPEFINAYEIGTKNSLASGRVQANITGFYYDYEGLQVSRIQNRTSFNDNVDSKIWGAELELTMLPSDRWLINANLSYLKTEIGEVSLVDTRDPTGGDPGATLIKDYTNYSNCVINANGGPPVIPTLQSLIGAVPALAPVFGPLPFSVCETLAGLDFSAFGLPYTWTDGNRVPLEGNELQNSPELSFSFGAQYTFPLASGYELSVRGDYYWQDDSWGRIFNRDPIDRIESWDIINAQVTLTPDDGSWYLRGFVQNLADDDNVTGLYVTDPSSGLFTNVFTLEPRRYGVAFGINFD